MEAKMSVLFYLRKAKTMNDNLVPIYLRVTIDGKRFEVTTDRFIDSSRWSSRAGKMKGTSEEFRCINNHLDRIKRKAFEYQQDILLKNLPLTVETFKSKWWGLCENHYTLLHFIFRFINLFFCGCGAQEFVQSLIKIISFITIHKEHIAI